MAEISFDEATYRKLIGELKARTGVGLQGYRVGVAQRRISRRARNVGCKSLVEYLTYFRGNSSEADTLAELVTLPVGRFFRNSEVFETVAEDVLPRIFDGARRFEKITIWCAGCGEGEEPYSLAIILGSKFANEMEQNHCRIIGTDINSAALEKAGLAGYVEDRLVEISPSLKYEYFKKVGNCWKLKEEIKNMVKFRRESMPDDGGVRNSHLVMIRNLLIYFDREQQDLILEKVTSCMKARGFLVLGKAETLPNRFRELFETVSSQHRIYRKAAQ